MPIKHLVLPGGGTAGFCLVGALQKLHDAGVWNLDDIKSIYSVSAGSLIAVLIALKFNWDTIVDYILNRPWSNVYKVNLTNIIDIFLKKGFYDTDFFVTFFKPFFDSRDISMNITLSELYEITGVDVHFCTVEMTSLTFIGITHETHPDLEVLKAIQMSAAYPLIVSPVFNDGKYYIDGGLLCNYPIDMCLKKYPNKDEVLGMGNSIRSFSQEITSNSSLFEFIEDLLFKMVMNLSNRIHNNGNRDEIDNYVSIPIPKVTMTNIQNTFSDKELRRKLITDGAECAATFLAAHGIITEDEPKDEPKDDNISSVSQENKETINYPTQLSDAMVFC
jgi:predicted acylesterase/phospholipase RssA